MRKKMLFVLAASMLVMTACSSSGDEKATGLTIMSADAASYGL